MEEREHEWWLLVGGVLAGAAIGATAALLLAPRYGSQTREYLFDTAERLKARTDRLAESVKDMLESQRALVEEAVQAGKQAAAEKAEELHKRLRGQEEA